MIYKFGKIQRQCNLDDDKNGLSFVKDFLPDFSQEILSMAVDGEEISLINNISSKAKFVNFYSLSDYTGARVMAISTTALMLTAARLLFPEVNISIEHSYSSGFYCVPQNISKLPDNYLDLLKIKMDLLIRNDIEFKEEEIPISKINKFKKGRFKIFEDASLNKIRMNKINGFSHWFLSPLTPSSSYIKKYNLHQFHDGFVLQFLNTKNSETLPPIQNLPKLFSVFRESANRGELLSVKFVDQLNKRVKSHKGILETIQIYEALHEKKISEIADVIANKKVKLIFISGPSSSGKTTFMKRLNIQLRINNINPINISLDNYFVNREKTPKDENGNYDFEHFDAIDHKLLNKHLVKLLNGKQIYLPKFDFKNGKHESNDKKVKIESNTILIIEGIHGLNPKLTQDIDRSKLLKIYVSTLTQLNLNLYNRVSTSDTRLLRRMVRDMQFRDNSVEETLKRWASVRAGEDRWIFPFQENADIIFNSALEYEWNVFHPILKPELEKIDVSSPIKNDAMRLCKLLKLYLPITTKYIPPTSILREYIGESSFSY